MSLASKLTNNNNNNNNIDRGWEFRKGTTAVVTGGTKGIGKAIVEELAHKGCRVLTCCRNSDELKKCIIEWQQQGLHNIDGIAVDISTNDGRQVLLNEIYEWLSETREVEEAEDEKQAKAQQQEKRDPQEKENGEGSTESNDDTKKTTKTTKTNQKIKTKKKKKVDKHTLQLDILVNNVGTNIRKLTVDYTQEEIQKIFDTNFFSMYSLTAACYPLLKRKRQQQNQRTSSVINIGSVAGVTCMKSGTPYASTKAAMNQLTGNLVRISTEVRVFLFLFKKFCRQENIVVVVRDICNEYIY